MDNNAAYSVIVSSTVDIIKHIENSNDPKSTADELFSAEILSLDEYMKALEEPDKKKIARIINMAFMQQVKNNYDNFTKILGILRKAGLKEIADKLEQKLREKLASEASHDPSGQLCRMESNSSSGNSDVEADFSQCSISRKRQSSHHSIEPLAQHPRTASISSSVASDIDVDYAVGGSLRNPFSPKTDSVVPMSTISRNTIDQERDMTFAHLPESTKMAIEETKSSEMKHSPKMEILPGGGHRPDCKEEAVKKVLRKVSCENLARIQLELIDHPDQLAIIDSIDAKEDYFFEKHDATVHIWFQIGKPSWKKLISVLNSCHENVIANTITTGEIFEPILSPEIEGIHYSSKRSSLLASKLKEKGDHIKSEAMKNLELGYKELMYEITQMLEDNNIVLKDFLKHAGVYFSESVGKEFQNIKEFFNTAEKYRELSMLHYSSLAETLKRIFKHDPHKICLLFSNYEEKLANFNTATKIVEFLRSHNMEESLIKVKTNCPFNIHESPFYDELGLKIDIGIEEKSLQYIQDLWKSLRRKFYLAQATVVLEDIREACIQVIWRVPKAVSNNIMHNLKSNIKYFVANHIRIVWINRECIYHEKIHHSNDTKLAQLLLAQACESGKALEAKFMLMASGIKVNSPDIITGKTPLMLAAEQGSTKIVKMLMDKNASPNKKEDSQGWTALFYAAKKGHRVTVENLLEHEENKANILSTDNEGHTVLDLVEEQSRLHEYLNKVTQTHHHLLEACERGDLSKVESLIERESTNINAIRDDGMTPLMLAAQHGHADIIYSLILHNVNVLSEDSAGNIAVDYIRSAPRAFKYLSEETLIASAARGNVAILKKILDLQVDPNARQNDEDNYTALVWACENGHYEAAKTLLQNGADPNAESTSGWTGLLTACRNDHFDIAKAILELDVNVNKTTEDGWTALQLVACSGNTEVAEILLTKGANPYLQDVDGFTPLTMAAQDGHYELVKLLAEKSEFPIDGHPYRTIIPDDWSPIMLATKNGHTEIVKYLVKNGANIHRKKEDGTTVLHIATYNGHLDLVRYLCLDRDTQMNVNVQDEDGITPLMYAAKEGHLEIAKVLLQKSADISIQENDIQWTAPYFAVEGGHIEVFNYFLEYHGGKEVDLNHTDIKDNTIIDLSLVINGEAYRALQTKNPERLKSHKQGILQKPVSMKYDKLKTYDYFNAIVSKFNKKVEGRGELGAPAA